MSRFDDDILGSEDMDELDLAEEIMRRNPRADQLQHFADLRGAKHAKLNAQAPFVRNNPVSALSGSLANQAQPEITTENAQTPPWNPTGNFFNLSSPLIQVANWQGDDSETLPVTVTLAPVQFSSQLPITAPARPFAIIQFGTRGALAEFEVDIATGVQFTLNASTVNIRVGLETAAGIVLPPGTNLYTTQKLAGMLSFHTTTHNLTVTRTRYGESAPAPASYIVPVPAFSRNVAFWRGTPATFAYTLEFQDSTGATQYTVTIAAGATSVLFDLIPLSGDITQIEVTRTDASPSGGFEKLIFGLGF